MRLVGGGRYAALDVVPTTGSTSADLAAAARRGAPDRSILIAEEQVAGRGRKQRSWTSLRGYGLYVSVLLRPAGMSPSGLAWLPLITGVALADTVARLTPVPTGLKWPNDLLLGDGRDWYKAAGILADVVGTAGDIAVVVGMGVNVHHRRDQLPARGGFPATSLAAQGAEVDREEFAVELLASLAEVDDQWRRYDGDVVAGGLFDRYRRWCRTLGQQVRVDVGSEQFLHGTATGIDRQGRLMVRGIDGAVTPVSAGDVVHVRPASPTRE